MLRHLCSLANVSCRPLTRRSFATSSHASTGQPLYTASVHTIGGRNGSSESSDGALKVTLSTPKSMGGQGGVGTNPEQMFAAGYSACFLGAMGVAAKNLKLQLPPDTAIDAQVALSRDLQLAVTFDISGGRDRDAMQRIVDEAHQICPYSKATRSNIPVKLNVK